MAMKKKVGSYGRELRSQFDAVVCSDKAQDAFVPIELPAPEVGDIRIVVRNGQTSVEVNWPLSAAGECAALLGELLR